MPVTTAASSSLPSQTIELSPSYTLPLGLLVVAVPLLLFSPWLASAIAIFGLFLLFQAVTIRLQFTPTALDVYRSDKMIRRFPYQEWQNWKIFWTPVPILFYFKEVNSIHFLPMLFDPKMLRTCLEERCPIRN
ncbi:DUF3119 family protein [Funiculus sociatus GB2-A5]|jgi:hypothetical protein|uniref:DUF3119 family protein n=1 Tax=Funiculus sociatus GB2-A5 TaxID=2933946 RepID=A0ABV0JK25_9CYAN|nr:MULTISPECIES: DUF3119 family protein [unclassified Trichocoleus]MBD1904684.1 DUF3119 family protein [Trichocoleus sp. FACHB-832]MBD2062482.1 DUF3119 family protein [Trichocoleus sp. FACHB-6]